MSYPHGTCAKSQTPGYLLCLDDDVRAPELAGSVELVPEGVVGAPLPQLRAVYAFVTRTLGFLERYGALRLPSEAAVSRCDGLNEMFWNVWSSVHGVVG